MQEKTLQLFLFPHSVLPEGAARSFLTLWGRLDCLRAIGPVYLPEWAEPLCESHVLVKDDGFWERVRNIYKGYQDLGSRVGEDGLMAVLSRDWAGEGAPETRGHIQSVLRGMSPKPLDPADGLLMEAVVFLEMAKELDIRELELSMDLKQVGHLEEKLFKALGADEEDSAELQRALETTNPPLSPDWGHFGYLLRQRIGFWFRLLSRIGAKEPAMVLAALGRDVVDEALDALQTATERQGKVWHRGETRILTLPRLDLLSPIAFAEWLEAVQGLEARNQFQRAFETFIMAPTEPQSARELSDAAHGLEQSLKSLWVQLMRETLGTDGARVVVTAPEHGTYQEMWRSLDRTGLEALGTGSVPQQAAILVHVE